jgi:hypothetical protein
MWTHCVTHCESLATKELCPELSEVMDAVVKTANYIKTRPSKRDFCSIIGGNGGKVSVTPVLL